MSQPPPLKRTILLIEDEHQMRTLIVLMLEQAGHDVLEAASSQEAAAVWKKHSHVIDAIVADVWLPGITGPELVDFFRRDRSSVKSVFISGMNAFIRPEMSKLTRGHEIVRKPFKPEELIAALNRAFLT